MQRAFRRAEQPAFPAALLISVHSAAASATLMTGFVNSVIPVITLLQCRYFVRNRGPERYLVTGAAWMCGLAGSAFIAVFTYAGV